MQVDYIHTILNVKMIHFLSHFLLRPYKAEEEITGSKHFHIPK